MGECDQVAHPRLGVNDMIHAQTHIPPCYRTVLQIPRRKRIRALPLDRWRISLRISFSRSSPFISAYPPPEAPRRYLHKSLLRYRLRQDIRTLVFRPHVDDRSPTFSDLIPKEVIPNINVLRLFQRCVLQSQDIVPSASMITLLDTKRRPILQGA